MTRTFPRFLRKRGGFESVEDAKDEDDVWDAVAGFRWLLSFFLLDLICCAILRGRGEGS